VLIDLGALYGRQPHFQRPNVIMTVSLDHVVAGLLDAWVLTSTGWFGACRYHVKLGYGRATEQRHLIPAWALKSPSALDLRQAEMRGDLGAGRPATSRDEPPES
jgi:hypothetical protein